MWAIWRARRTVLVPGVIHLDPESTVFEAMLAGWALQQRTWFLEGGDDQFAAAARGGLPSSRMSILGNGSAPMWRGSLTVAGAGRSRSWRRRHGCMRRRFGCFWSTRVTRATDGLGVLVRFGVAPSQVMHEWNTIAHVTDYEGDPRRRLQVRFCIWRSRSPRAASEDFGCLVGVLGCHARDLKSGCAGRSS